MMKTLQTLVLLLAALMTPAAANAAWTQVADGVYQDGTTVCIGSGVTSLGSLQLNPSEIYCYATVPPACMFSTFTAYGATLHVPSSALVSYFTAQYWYNFTNVLADVIEPQSVTMSSNNVQVEIGKQLSLSATVSPAGATPSTIYWSSSNSAVATVSTDGMVTAKALGECYIRAICVDKQGLCRVTVTPVRVSISLLNQQMQLLSHHVLTLKAYCSPATDDLSVTTSDPAVAIPRIVNGTIQIVAVAEGEATITVSTSDGWCYPAQCQLRVYTVVGDTNRDGYINIADVTELIDYLLYGIWSVHEWVDLGLPSGTLWATCNVGASSPEDYGDYFAWGETEPKELYTWETYKWCNGSENTMTKYTTEIWYNQPDGKFKLDPEDDAAYVNWGQMWRMPSVAQIVELYNNCSIQSMTLNGVNGRLLTGPNSNTMFLPAVGERSNIFDSSLYIAGLGGCYWSCDRITSGDCDNSASVLEFSHPGSISFNHYYTRFYGLAVRAVRVSQN